MAKSETKGTDFKTMFKKLEVTLEEYLVNKAPKLPKEWKDIIVKIAPYLAIIGVVMGMARFLNLLRLGTFIAPLGAIGGMMAGRQFLGFNYISNIIFLGVITILRGLSISGLFSKSKKAWTFLYWSALVGTIQIVIGFGFDGFVIGIIGIILSLYFLFQVKEYYK